jgi:flagellar assembly protein FliH
VAPGDFAALVFPALDGHAHARRGGRDDDRARLEERWRARGHAAGYTEGLRAAAVAAAERAVAQAAEHEALLRTARAELEQSLLVLQNAARALDERTVPVLRDSEDTLLGAAIDLAEAIVGHAVADEAAAVRFALGRTRDGAMAGGSAAQPHTVRLHPHDLALLQAAPTDRPAGGLPTGVTLVADAGLARGDAVSEFPDGYLDARIGSALDRARAALGPVPS